MVEHLTGLFPNYREGKRARPGGNFDDIFNGLSTAHKNLFVTEAASNGDLKQLIQNGYTQREEMQRIHTINQQRFEELRAHAADILQEHHSTKDKLTRFMNWTMDMINSFWSHIQEHNQASAFINGNIQELATIAVHHIIPSLVALQETIKDNIGPQLLQLGKIMQTNFISMHQDNIFFREQMLAIQTILIDHKKQLENINEKMHKLEKSDIVGMVNQLYDELITKEKQKKETYSENLSLNLSN